MDGLFRSRLDALRKAGVRPGLDTMRALLERLGNPHRSLRCVHVAGTNGKGAVCAMLDAILRAAGYTTARYASPHLVVLNERFFLDGEPVSDAVLDDAAGAVFPAVDDLAASGTTVTFFECLTAMAFLAFRRAQRDVVIVETGLGGRLDATNVLENTLVAVITRIGLDHCDKLGATHGAIAAEKAGILRAGRPVVCGLMPESARETVARCASVSGCPFTAVEDHVAVRRTSPLVLTTAQRNPPPIALALAGSYQVENAMTAVTAADVLVKDCGFEISDRAVCEGFASVVWPGRFQRVRRDGVTFVVDGAHNPDGSMALRDALRPLREDGPIALVCGFCGDKDVLANLRILSAVTTVGWAVPLANARSLDPAAVAERMILAGFVSAAATPALDGALAAAAAWARENGGTVVVCGSLFLAGEALVRLNAFPWSVRQPDANESW